MMFLTKLGIVSCNAYTKFEADIFRWDLSKNNVQTGKRNLRRLKTFFCEESYTIVLKCSFWLFIWYFKWYIGSTLYCRRRRIGCHDFSDYPKADSADQNPRGTTGAGWVYTWFWWIFWGLPQDEEKNRW